MGKYSNSEIHNLYSDWHWRLIELDEKYKRLYVADIDRLWIEYDFEMSAVVAIIDIKWECSDDGMTSTEKGIYEWFENNGVKYYIVYISKDFKKFIVQNSRKEEKTFTDIEYADLLLSLRTKKYQYNTKIKEKTKLNIDDFVFNPDNGKGYKDIKIHF